MEREIAKKNAGLRTHMLVAGTAALLVLLGDIMIQNFDQKLIGQIVRSDPIRIIEAIITGISFLCTGVIITQCSPFKVEGLTTAASILFSAALGVCVALSQLILAISITAIVFIILHFLKYFDQWLDNRSGTNQGESLDDEEDS